MATIKHMESAVDSKGKQRDVEVFVFQNPAKRKREEKDEKKLKHQEKQSHPSIKKREMKADNVHLDDMRKHVRNLGISAMVGRSKMEARMSQLKRLGAEIPKIWERKIEKTRRHVEFIQRRQDIKAGLKRKVGKDPKKAAQTAKEPKKKKDSGVFFDGQIGKYKDGIQYISSADIKRVRESAKK